MGRLIAPNTDFAIQRDSRSVQLGRCRHGRQAWPGLLANDDRLDRAWLAQERNTDGGRLLLNCGEFCRGETLRLQPCQFRQAHGLTVRCNRALDVKVHDFPEHVVGKVGSEGWHVEHGLVLVLCREAGHIDLFGGTGLARRFDSGWLDRGFHRCTGFGLLH